MKSIPAIRLTFFAMAGALTASLVVIWWIGRETLRRGTEITQREATLGLVRKVFSTLQDAETGQRGYLLTGREAYLDPYENAIDDLPAHKRHIRHASQAGEIPKDLADRFLKYSEEKMQELAQTVRLLRERHAQQAMSIVLTDTGKKRMDSLRTVTDEIITHEETQLLAAQIATRHLTNLRTALFAAAALANLAFLLWAYRRIRREVSRRYVADLDTQRQREILAVSLASIGDAVILTDVESRIVFLNEVAEQLTGWSRSEAVDRPCGDVFRIVNETTRMAVESPVDLVLRTGKIVGLANHTLLIRKDGSEIPIDDSGAPVRESDGTVRGVVLVFRDFSQHKATERDLIEMKDRLETANKAKDDFLAALSHELRTPLTPVLAALSSWEADRTLPPSIAGDVRMLSRNVRLEARLIDDLLDLTRITRGQITLRKEKLDAHALLGTVVDIFRHAVEPRQIRIGVRTAAGRHFVEADPARLHQVFWNIIGNAVKFTPDGGRIEIVTSNEDSNLRVTIADNGRGMSEETMQHLFQPFERTSGYVNYQSGGLGIGLTISQNLMLAHGGRIEARSAGDGLGSAFVVLIPALAIQPPEARTSTSAKGGDSGGAPLSILLVEDHEDSAMVIGRILRNMGHGVEVSHTVADGVAKLRAGTFDIVLTDIGLPDGTGIELMEQAREFTKVPMVALTGYGMEDDLARYREAGFVHQITKPVRFDQLEGLLNDFAMDGRRGGLFMRSTDDEPTDGPSS